MVSILVIRLEAEKPVFSAFRIAKGLFSTPDGGSLATGPSTGAARVSCVSDKSAFLCCALLVHSWHFQTTHTPRVACKNGNIQTIKRHLCVYALFESKDAAF